MLLVSATIRTLPGKRAEFLSLIKPVIEATRKEEGNIFYALYASTEDENECMFFEKWSGHEALENHMKAAHVARYVDERNRLNLVEGPSVITTYELDDPA